MGGRLRNNVAASMLTATALLGTAAVAVPVIVHDLGTAGFGIWSLASTAVLYVSVAESGLGPALQRYVAVASGARDTAAIGRLLVSSLFLYLAAGLVLAEVAQVAAGGLVDAFKVPTRFEASAEVMFRITGLSMLLALLVAGVGNALQGLERFGWFALSSAIGAAVFLVGALVSLAHGHGLEGLAWSAAAQQGTMLIVRVGVLSALLVQRPQLIDRATVREILSFSWRLQASVLSILVNSQTDRVVVGLVAAPTTLGQVSIGGQVADGGRLVVGAALSPIISRLSAVHGEGDPAHLEQLFDRLNRLWTVVVVGVIAVGVGSISPLITAWLGEGYGPAGVFGAILFIGYGVNLLPSVSIAYLRALGRPGYEARYGLLTITLNVGATIAFGIAFGAYGVVVATAFAYLTATAWLLRSVAPVTPDASRALPVDLRGLATAMAAGAAAFGWGLLMNSVLPTGVALGPVLLGALAALLAHLVAATGISPTPARLREMLR